MLRNKTFTKSRWLLLAFLTAASLLFTGCDNGSLGTKGGAINGYVLTTTDNKPISDVIVRAKGAATSGNASVYTDGDGSFVMSDLAADNWTLSVEKYGYAVASESVDTLAQQITLSNGETITAPVIRMEKQSTLYTGVLKGYPIDAVTGRALTNFTVNQTYPYTERKSKTFETAADFRDSGWTGLEGGDHQYTITAANYTEYSTAGTNADSYISIGASVSNLGTILVQPLTVNISGTLENLPGYVYSNTTQNIVIWAESSGKTVASFTSALNAESLTGSVLYTLANVPVTAGTVSVKCKVRGYSTYTIKSAVSLNSSTPGGTISGVDADFDNITPITRDLRVVVTGSEPDDTDPSSFDNGETVRIYIRQGGKDIVPYVDVVGTNYYAEAYISGVITGYPIVVYAQNLGRGYNYKESEATIIEEGSGAFTINVQLESH